MLKVYRNVLVSGVLALGLAACGDKVTVTQPVTPPPGVSSVVVTPQNASVGIGQSIQLAATVVADSGISTGLNWASSSNAIATVDQTGKVTGVAVGTTTVTATSTVNPARSSAVQITVTNSSTFNVTPSTLTLAPGQTSNLSVIAAPAAGQTVTTPVATSLSTTIATAGTCSAPAGNNSSCPITGVSQGTAVVTVVDSIGGVAFTQTVTVNVGAAASISIAAINAGATAGSGNCTGVVGAPVILTDVNCQIDVVLNLTAGIQPLDSLNIYVQHGTVAAGAPIFSGRASPLCAAAAAPCPAFKRAAQQIYGNSIPSSGPVSLSINTANFTKNVAKGTALVDWYNGSGALISQIFPHGLTGGSVLDCQIGANDPSCAVVNSMIFNNADGWAADITKCGGTINSATVCPAADPVGGKGGFANDSGGSNINTGKTYWGGPGVTGEVTAQLYAVVYNDNPSAAPGSSNNRCANQLGDGTGCISKVNWTLGSSQSPSGGDCPFVQESGTDSTPAPLFRQVFGSTGADVTDNCTGVNNVFSRRDNVVVESGALDGQSNSFSNGVLIANTVVPNATPDSLRIDWQGPSSVQRPTGQGWEEQHWVNATWAFNHDGTIIDDNGVGPAPQTWQAFVGPAFTTVIHTGADLAETNTNTTDGYTARATGTDRLGNATNSQVTTAFGVDKTAPSLRYSTVAAPSSYASIYTGGGAATVLDSTTYNAFQGLYGTNVLTAGAQDLFVGLAAGTNDSVRVEAIDSRSGLYRGIEMVNDFAQGGATGTTTSVLTENFTIFDANNTVIGFLPATIDGWLPLHAQGVTGGSTNPGYYTTTMYTVDKAGNASGCPDSRATDGPNGAACTAAPASSSNLFARRTLALDPGQPQVTGVSPNNSYVGNMPAVFTLGSQNDLEVIDAKLRILYPNLTIGDAAGTIPAAGGLVWTYALSSSFMTGSGGGSSISSGPAAGSAHAFGFFNPIATRFDNSIINPSTTPLTLDLFTTNVQETCTSATTGVATGPTTAIDCGTSEAKFVGDPIPTDAEGFPLAIPTNVGVQVRDVFGSWIFNTTNSAVTGVSDEFVSPILSATVTPPVTTYGVSYIDPGLGQSCPAGGAVQAPGSPTCVTGNSSINFRADNNLTTAGTKVFRATEALSRSLPIFGRVDLFGLNAQQQWVFIARIVVPNPVAVNASCPASTPGSTGVVGCDNGLERYWLYTFTSVPATFTEYRAIGVDSHGSGLASTIHS